MFVILKRFVRFVPKHISWHRSKKRAIEKFRVDNPKLVFNKLQELKKEKIELEKYYLFRLKDEKYFKHKGWLEAIQWLLTLEK